MSAALVIQHSKSIHLSNKTPPGATSPQHSMCLGGCKEIKYHDLRRTWHIAAPGSRGCLIYPVHCSPPPSRARHVRIRSSPRYHPTCSPSPHAHGTCHPSPHAHGTRRPPMCHVESSPALNTPVKIAHHRLVLVATQRPPHPMLATARPATAVAAFRDHLQSHRGDSRPSSSRGHVHTKTRTLVELQPKRQTPSPNSGTLEPNEGSDLPCVLTACTAASSMPCTACTA
mmetsp:Transcript_35954/g.80037  ORF Transcript_35954/g.80037 Transcript_35954/m.80037 type:complete len:228 (+) Transcript_35954:99-782(+)